MRITGTKDFLFKVQKKLSRDPLEGIKGDFLEDRKNVLDLKVLVGVDISGSISQAQFTSFMKALDAIRGLSVVKVIEIDTDIVSFYDYFKVNKSRIVRLGGGGGTEFTPFFQKAKELNPDAIIFFTDGDVFSQIKDPSIPTGWVLSRGGRKPYPWGEVIQELEE